MNTEGEVQDYPDEGDNCRDKQCSGKYEFKTPAECYCHISPPCHKCVENELTCDECGLTAKDAEDMN